jgi:hypothetical protein
VEQKIHYLGHVIAKDGVAMDADKVFAVQSWPLPKTIKALRGFLDLTGYYRKFVHEYGVLVDTRGHGGVQHPQDGAHNGTCAPATQLC